MYLGYSLFPRVILQEPDCLPPILQLQWWSKIIKFELLSVEIFLENYLWTTTIKLGKKIFDQHFLMWWEKLKGLLVTDKDVFS